MLPPRRALRELDRTRAITLTTPGHNVELVIRRTPQQTAILDTGHVYTINWQTKIIKTPAA